jgi:hypothetical protein
MEHPKSLIGKTRVGRSIKSLNVPTSLSEQEMLVVVDKIISNPFITYSHSMCEQYLLDWSVEDDSYLSWFEKSQLEYDGEILFPEPIIEYGETLTYKEEMNV